MSSSASSSTMQAVLLAKPGGADQLSYGEAPRPTPGPTQLLLRVRATAANRADTLQREGKYPPPPGASQILGLECTGEVVGRGAECKRSDVPDGTRVMALLAGGGYAQYAVVDEGSVMLVPDNYSWVQAAAIPEVFLTAYLIARQLGELKEGDAVLIHAGASGVGTALIQLCKLFGATAIVSVSSDRKAAACKELGAAFHINYKSDNDWSNTIKNWTKANLNGKEGVDLILDCVGASHAKHNLEALAQDGRWILYGTMGGVEVDKFPLGAILRKRIRLQGSTLRARTVAYKAALVARFSSECLEALHQGKLKPIIHEEFPLKDVRKAHESMEGNDSIGKIIMTVEHNDK